MSLEKLNERTSKDLAAGYLLWMLSQGKSVREQYVIPEMLLSERMGEWSASSLVSSIPPFLERSLCRIVITGEKNEINSSDQVTMRSPVLKSVSTDSDGYHYSMTTVANKKPISPPPPRICSPTPNEQLSMYTSDDKISLPKWFRESKAKVVIGKGHLPRKTPGNDLLRRMVHVRLGDYQNTNRRGRAVIVSEIYHSLAAMNPDGRCFGNFDAKGNWCEAREHSARDKIAASFRDCLSHLYKSSTQSKVAKRRTRKAEKSAP
jgi:hypothetical protein